MPRAVFFTAVLLFACTCMYGQSIDSATEKLANFPTKLFGKIQSRAERLQRSLTRQTEKYLQQMAAQEARLNKSLSRVDSNAAKNLFTGSSARYAAMAQQLKTDTGSRNLQLSGNYQPYTDSLKNSLAFLQQNPQLLQGKNIDPATLAQLQGASSQLQALQAKMQDASQINTTIQQRKQLIGTYISQHANVETLMGKPYADLKQSAYYYAQQVREYREMLNDPDQLEKKALTVLSQLPAFQTFMKNNSQLATLFNLPSNYGSTTTLAGMQTRDQVGQLVQNQVAAAGSQGASSIDASFESAESQLDGFKDKLSKLGGGSGDVDMPDFKPNDQKTKTFWRRLLFGVNTQTEHTSLYYPTVTDIGLSLGYNLGKGNSIGVGASYKIGWGNGLEHIALSSQGVGLRSYVDIKLQGTLSLTGGFEYNYTTPFSSFQNLPLLQYWTKSGLIGLSKNIPVKNGVFKKTSVQLLWDFLSYQQIPRTQPVLFRVGYSL